MEMDPLLLPHSLTTSLPNSQLILPTFLFIVLGLFLYRVFGSRRHRLPPGPKGLPILGNLLQIRPTDNNPYKDFIERVRSEYGKIFTVRLGNRPTVVISSAELAHEALIQKGASFSSRPDAGAAKRIFSCGKFTVNSSTYGPVWRTLRRNMVSEMLSAARLREFSMARKHALDRMVARFSDEAAQNGGVVPVLKNARFTVFCVLLYMCFGVEMEEEEVFWVESLLKRVIMVAELRIDDFVPVLRPFFAAKQREVQAVRDEQMKMLLPIINKRRDYLKKVSGKASPTAYVDTLFDLSVEGRKSPRMDEELVTLCAEFLNGGVDTTASGLEWAVAQLVLNPDMQNRMAAEIQSVVGDRRVEDTDLPKLDYVGAFVKELLRRHPPVHFTVTHATTEDTKIGGYDIPAGTAVDFYIHAMSEDPVTWESPEKFMPERFMGDKDDVDLTGVRKIKMMPFGVGRRICPGLAMGMLHMNLILARMVQEFEWSRRPDTPEIDLTGKYAFTVIMKEPLHAVIRPRKKVVS